MINELFQLADIIVLCSFYISSNKNFVLLCLIYENVISLL